MTQIIDYSPTWQEAVIDLWQACDLLRPWNDPMKDIARKLTDTRGKFWLLISPYSASDQDQGELQRLLGTIMLGYDGHRGSVNYLAIAPRVRGQGYGRQLMAQCEDYLQQLGCPKINLCVRTTNSQVIDFYQALDYQQDAVVVLSKRLIADA